MPVYKRMSEFVATLKVNTRTYQKMILYYKVVLEVDKLGCERPLWFYVSEGVLDGKTPSDKALWWQEICRQAAESGVSITLKYLQFVKTAVPCAKELRVPLHLCVESKSCLWYTPSWLWSRILRVMGGVDLDPCSDVKANQLIKSPVIYTREQNGLQLRNKWWGKVYVNPPYGTVDGESLAGKFLDRAIHEFKVNKRIECIVLLLKVATTYDWWKPVFKYPHAFLDERVEFTPGADTDYAGKAFQAHVVVYLGHDTATFAKIFSEFSNIPGYNTWAFR